MSRIIKRLLLSINKNHFIMVLVLLVLTIIIPFKANARMSDYSTFDWDSFYAANKTYWSHMCENDSNENECINDIVYYQKDFYTKLYGLLAKYQSEGIYLSDDVIIATVFYELLPTYSGKPEMDEKYKMSYSIYGKKNERAAIKIDKEDMDPSIEDNYDADDDLLSRMANYFDNESDTIVTLTKNMVAYYTYCYGSYGDPVTEQLSDGTTRKVCNEGTKTTLIRHDTLVNRSFEKCVDNLSSSSIGPGYELGFWTYYTSRLEYDTLLKPLARFFGFHIVDEQRNNCLSRAEEYPDGVYYIYVDEDDNNGRHVSYNKYFDFLKTSKYFDSKPHLQYRFSDVLSKAGVGCLTNDVCEDSLEASERYEEFTDELEKDRMKIIQNIIEILNKSGLDIEYNGYGTGNFVSVEQNRGERTGYYWPIGGPQVTETDGVKLADGSPTKTMSDISSYFGERRNPITNEREMNYGIDIATEEGVTNIIAAYNGIVAAIENNCVKGDYSCNDGYGNMVLISHSNGDFTVYANLSSVDDSLQLGESVTRGQFLGKAGATGKTNTSILHYEIRVGGNSITNSVDPLTNTSAGNQNPPSTGDLRPGGGGGSSGVGARSPKFDGTNLTRAEYVGKLGAYCARKPKEIAGELCNDPGMVYDVSQSANVNPELVIARAMAEGNSPGVSKHNYWGMGCTNTGGYAACITYSSVENGIRGFGANIQRYNTLRDMMQRYGYIGAVWYNPGSWSIGGCKYFPYIRQYMSEARGAYVDSVCGKSTTCNLKGGDCTPTTGEDQDAYATWQVENKLGPYMHNVFGT